MPDSDGLDPPAQGRRHRPARPHAGDRAGRRRRRGRPARHPDQQRVPDRTPLAGRLRPAGRGRVAAAAGPARAPGAGDVRPDLRGPPGRDRRCARADRRSPTTRASRSEHAARPSHNAATLDRAGAQGRARLARRAPGRHRRRRRRPAARRPDQQLVDPDRRARSTRWSCSRCSCATRSRRSCWSPGCARRCGRRVGSDRSRRAYVVNVSAMEGQFSRRYKGAGHPHTNMAKAALNMLTRTSRRARCSRPTGS